jgi:hypothetical protein
MLYDYFDYPYAPMVATLAWSILIGLIGHIVVFRLRIFEQLLKSPLAPPSMGLPLVMFAFLMAFMASAAWQNISLARVSLINERTAVARIIAIPIAPETEKQQARLTLGRYLTAVIEEEWEKHHNQMASPAAEEALSTLERQIWAAHGLCSSKTGENPPCSDALMVSTFVKALDDLRLARDERLSLGLQGTLMLKWVLAVALAMMTATSIAAVHRASARTAAIALTLFCLSIWVTFSMVALHIQPYRGPDALSSDVLRQLRSTL